MILLPIIYQIVADGIKSLLSFELSLRGAICAASLVFSLLFIVVNMAFPNRAPLILLCGLCLSLAACSPETDPSKTGIQTDMFGRKYWVPIPGDNEGGIHG